MSGEIGREPGIAEMPVDDLTQRSTAIKELELRCEIVRCFAEREEDENAYNHIARVIREAICASRCDVAYMDGKGERRSTGDGALATQPPEDAGKAIQHKGRLESGFGVGGSAEGSLAVESDAGEFGREAISLFEAALAEIERLVLARQSKARRDITRHEAEKALRRSEERLRTFFEESRDMIYTVNGDDVVASINQAGISLLGLKDRFEIVGRPFSLFL
ncbi:MAG: PAS domain S-box protein, partial [Spirochaetaceae bacterium]|nr:PAS domain S-box protein [Spirochaetaceae bacterium]